MPLTYRNAVKLIRRCGGRLRRHGSRHDVFVLPDGTEVVVPRHAGDFSFGVESEMREIIDGQSGTR